MVQWFQILILKYIPKRSYVKLILCWQISCFSVWHKNENFVMNNPMFHQDSRLFQDWILLKLSMEVSNNFLVQAWSVITNSISSFPNYTALKPSSILHFSTWLYHWHQPMIKDLYDKLWMTINIFYLLKDIWIRLL